MQALRRKEREDTSSSDVRLAGSQEPCMDLCVFRPESTGVSHGNICQSCQRRGDSGVWAETWMRVQAYVVQCLTQRILHPTDYSQSTSQKSAVTPASTTSYHTWWRGKPLRTMITKLVFMAIGFDRTMARGTRTSRRPIGDGVAISTTRTCNCKSPGEGVPTQL